MRPIVLEVASNDFSKKSTTFNKQRSKVVVFPHFSWFNTFKTPGLWVSKKTPVAFENGGLFGRLQHRFRRLHQPFSRLGTHQGRALLLSSLERKERSCGAGVGEAGASYLRCSFFPVHFFFPVFSGLFCGSVRIFFFSPFLPEVWGTSGDLLLFQ